MDGSQLGEQFDTKNTPPLGLKGIFRTTKIDDVRDRDRTLIRRTLLERSPT